MKPALHWLRLLSPPCSPAWRADAEERMIAELKKKRDEIRALRIEADKIAREGYSAREIQEAKAKARAMKGKKRHA